jgi:CubicO group peptidase (beta-lactamase class C family)
MHPGKFLLAACFLTLALAACGGGGGEPPPPPIPDTTWSAVESAVTTAVQANSVPGLTLSVYDRNGRQVYVRAWGDAAPSRRLAVASASKLVSGVVLLRLVDQGLLTLESTTGAVLGWQGPQAAITLRQLLSFTSGLQPDPDCTNNALVTLAACVDTISQLPMVAPPATRFDYGSGHLHVAARMAEVLTGESWDAIVQRQLRTPLGLPAEFRYYTYPQQALGLQNPLIAGGLRASADEYARLLGVVYQKGLLDGQRLISAALFDEQAREPYPNVVIGTSPAQQAGYPFRYGLTAWLECATPATGCTSLDSAGAFGFTPWIDRAAGYYAILGMELAPGAGTQFGIPLEQQLKPLVAQAIARLP